MASGLILLCAWRLPGWRLSSLQNPELFLMNDEHYNLLEGNLQNFCPICRKRIEKFVRACEGSCMKIYISEQGLISRWRLRDRQQHALNKEIQAEYDETAHNSDAELESKA